MFGASLNNQKVKFAAKLNIKYYICTVLLAAICTLGWYAIYFLNANTILMDDEPMSNDTKIMFTILMTAVVLSWTLSLVVLIRQMISGKAFYLDESGIHNTLNATIVLAFIFIVPIREIPYCAILNTDDIHGVFLLNLDKSKVNVMPVFRPFIRKIYTFCNGFTTAKTEEIKEYLPK